MNVPNQKGQSKPAKPYPAFPLFPHASGRWAKKIRGKLHYFGPWRDPDKALAKYLRDKDYLHAGKVPPASRDGATIRDVLNAFLIAKDLAVESGELQPRTRADYGAVTDRLAAFWEGSLDMRVSDLTPADFEKLRAELARGAGPVTLANLVTRVRIIFKYAYDIRLVPEPVNMGTAFRKPSAQVQRINRQEQGDTSFHARHIRRMIRLASPPLRAMIMLGINCGFGNTDCAELPAAAVDLHARWINWPRPKNGTYRRCPLWPQTAAAVCQALRARPQPADPDDAALVFLTAKGRRWAKDDDRTLSKAFGRLLDLAGCRRRGVNFYSLRRTFETVAGASLDQPAVDLIMGHVPDAADMAARYRQRIDDSRLVAVVERVHRWLFRCSPDGFHRLAERSGIRRTARK